MPARQSLHQILRYSTARRRRRGHRTFLVRRRLGLRVISGDLGAGGGRRRGGVFTRGGQGRELDAGEKKPVVIPSVLVGCVDRNVTLSAQNRSVLLTKHKRSSFLPRHHNHHMKL